MIFRRIGLFAATLLLAVGLMAHDPPLLAAAECEGDGNPLCEQHEICLNFIFAEFCSIEYEYYDTEEGDPAPCTYCHGG